MKTIFITGANRGLGLEMARAYLTAKWFVIAACRDPGQANELNDLKSQYSDQLQIIQLDVLNENQIRQTGKQFENQPIDILMNNAGVIGSKTAKLGEISEAEWLDVFRINTIVPLLLAQALLPSVEKSTRKIIANMSSILGSISANEESGYYTYRASKAALNALVKNMAIDLRDKQIIVIALHPGWVKTDMGGEGAPLQPEESVAGIRRVLDTVTLHDSGKFFSYENQELVW